MRFEEANYLTNNIITECTAERYANMVLNKSYSDMKEFNNKIIRVEAKQNNYKYINAGDYTISIGTASNFSRFFNEVRELTDFKNQKGERQKIIISSLNDLIKKIKSPNPRLI